MILKYGQKTEELHVLFELIFKELWRVPHIFGFLIIELYHLIRENQKLIVLFRLINILMHIHDFKVKWHLFLSYKSARADPNRRDSFIYIDRWKEINIYWEDESLHVKMYLPRIFTNPWWIYPHKTNECYLLLSVLFSQIYHPFRKTILKYNLLVSIFWNCKKQGRELIQCL